MLTYRYRGRSIGGEVVAGSVAAPDSATAVRLLNARAIVLTGLEPVLESAPRSRRPRRLATRVRTGFFRSVATLVAAAVPLRRSLLAATQRDSDPHLRGMVQHVVARLDEAQNSARPCERSPVSARRFWPL